MFLSGKQEQEPIPLTPSLNKEGEKNFYLLEVEAVFEFLGSPFLDIGRGLRG